jgi:NAD+ kinase
MATVAILCNPLRVEARRLLDEIEPWLASEGHQVRLLRLPDADRGSGRVPGGDLGEADLSGTDLAVSLGGDGTFLRMVPLAYAAGVPVLGVNFGRLGYLLEVEPNRLRHALARALADELTVEERMALAVTVDGALEPAEGDDRSLEEGGPTAGRWWVALNEMVAEKTVPGHMVHLETAVDGEPCLTYRADGVLVATPTGSTAYNLSAGGPLVSTLLHAMVLTPVAPHLTADRSVVLPAGQVISVTVGGGRPAVLVVDGREVGRLSPGARVECRVAPRPVRFVSLGERGFPARLRTAMSLDGRAGR